MLVRELMQTDVLTFRREDSLDALDRAVAESTQDVFPVVNEKGRVVGSVTEMDLVSVAAPGNKTFTFGPRKLAREGLVRQIEDVMTPRPTTARPDEEVGAALKKMQDLRLPQLIVVDGDGQLAGLLRGRDAYRARFGRAR